MLSLVESHFRDRAESEEFRSSNEALLAIDAAGLRSRSRAPARSAAQEAIASEVATSTRRLVYQHSQVLALCATATEEAEQLAVSSSRPGSSEVSQSRLQWRADIAIVTPARQQ